MHGVAGGPSEWRSRLLPAAAVLLVVACGAPPSGKVPDFLASLPSLGTASARYDSAMSTFTGDLEAWAVRAGRPTSAEALLGPMLLRTSRFHSVPATSDTGLEADYQRLDLRFAALLDQGDSLRHAADTAYDQLLAWAGREAEPAADRTDSLRSPVFPPPPNDPGRGTVAMVKCSLISVSVLPSKEGVHVCVLKEKKCTRMPADEIGDAWWLVRCVQACFDYIGWVPEGGGFTVGQR